MARRRFVAGSLAAAVLLTACGGDGQAGDEELSGTISFASYHWLEQGRGEALSEIISQYEDENPGVTIERTEISRGDFERVISTEIGAGDGPDVFIMPDTFFSELSESGALLPLDDVVSDDITGRLLPAAEDFVVDGERLALLWEVSAYSFFWNEQLLEEAGVDVPETPQELVEVAVAVAEETGATGFAARHQMNEESGWWSSYANWLYGFGGAWSDGENLTINSDENIEALEAYKELYDSGAFAVGDDSSTFRSRFGQGQVGLLIDCLPCMRTITREGDGIESREVGGGAFPLPGGEFANVTVGFGINVNTDNEELAKDFVQWLYTEEVQEQIFVDVQFPSTAGIDMEIPEELREEHPWAEHSLANLDSSSNSLIPGFELQTPEIRTIVLNQMERVLTGGVSPEEALNQAQNEAESVVR